MTIPTLSQLIVVAPMLFLAGFVDAIAGGGGLISIPAYLFAGLPSHLALGTNKLSAAIGTSFSTLRYCKSTKLNPQFVLFTAALALGGSACGAQLTLLVDESVLHWMLLFALPVVGFVVLRNRSEPGDGTTMPDLLSPRSMLVGGFIAFFLGTYDGFFGPGTGTFLLLCFVGLMKMDLLQACANVKVINLSSSIASLTVFAVHGQVMLLLGLVGAFFCSLGHASGAHLVVQKGFSAVRPIILVVLALLFVKLLIELV